MPWLEADRVMLRTQLVMRRTAGEKMTALCKQLNVSRKTGHKWFGRFEQEGLPGLRDRCRAPGRHPNQTPDHLASLVEQARLQNPAWGPLKIKHLLEREGHQMPSARTLGNVLKRRGLVAEPVRQEPALGRFERSTPNELWQMDAKGWFVIRGTGRVYPVSIVDDHSRYLVALRACRRENYQAMKATLMLALQEHGCPEALLTDRHTVFYQRGGLTAWECLLIALRIACPRGRPRRPTTQGKVERLHLTLQTELIRRYRFSDLADCQRAFDEWRQMYNTYRPHQALEGEVPATRYRSSARPLPDPIAQPRYGPEAIVRTVNGAGLISMGGKTRFLGKGLAGWQVGILPCEKERPTVMFYDRVVGRLRTR